MPKLPLELGLKKTYENITKLDLTFPSDVESTFTLVIDEICETAEQFDIQTDVLDKVVEQASYFQKTYIKGETLGRQQHVPPALWNHYDNAAAGLI